MSRTHTQKLTTKLMAGGFAISLMIMCALPSYSSEIEPIFDLSHVREAIHYFEDPTNKNISHVAFTTAAAKLRHYFNSQIKNGGSYGQESTYETTTTLLTQTVSSGMLSRIKALITLMAGSDDKQQQCVTKAQSFLPQGVLINQPLYIVWGDGKNRTMSIDGIAILDITSQDYRDRSHDVWVECVLSIHKAQMQILHPIPFSLSQITHSDEMLAYVEQLVLINGASYYAAYSTHPSVINEVETQEKYNQLRASLAGTPRILNNDDWQLINTLLDDTQTARNMGIVMARKIDSTLGRTALTHAYKGGAASFFRAFNELN